MSATYVPRRNTGARIKPVSNVVAVGVVRLKGFIRETRQTTEIWMGVGDIGDLIRRASVGDPVHDKE